MDTDKKRLTEENWIDFCKRLHTGDIIFEESNDILGKLISWGTGNNSNIDPSHVFQYIGDGAGKIIEATNNGVVFDVIEKYKNKFINLQSRLVVYRIIDLTVNDLEKMKEKWNKMVGLKYGFLSYIGWSFYVLINKFTQLGGVFKLNILRNPFSKREAPICSQVIYMAIEDIENIKRLFKTKNYFYENCIPENLENILSYICLRVNDSFKYTLT